MVRLLLKSEHLRRGKDGFIANRKLFDIAQAALTIIISIITIITFIHQPRLSTQKYIRK